MNTWPRSTPMQPTLSESYRKLNAELHEREPMYGTTGRRFVDHVRTLAKEQGARSILDYGCGKRDLWAALKDEFDVRNYDPAIACLDDPPEPADLVACIDVLEHVEPEYLKAVLSDLTRVTRMIAFITIATRPSGKVLADGTNPHRIIENSTWWLNQLALHFRIVKASYVDSGLEVVLVPLGESASSL